MILRRKTEITILTDRVLAVKNVSPTISAECPVCAGRVQMLTAEIAAKTFCVSPRRIYRLIENSQLHFQETPEGLLLVCPDSLSAVEAEKLLEKTEH